MSNAFNLFNALLNIAATEVPFDESFNNGTGYFDPLVKKEINIGIGDFGKFTTGGGRKGLIIKTRNHGNVILFTRYSGEEVICFNVSKGFASLIDDVRGSLSVEDINEIIHQAAVDVITGVR